MIVYELLGIFLNLVGKIEVLYKAIEVIASSAVLDYAKRTVVLRVWKYAYTTIQMM